jgi:ATP-dependent DNA helicase DinG
MDKVWEILAGRKMPFPMFQLRKGSIREIEKFKKSRNGVLFAAGALWEGIDIPGDPLSMLIIAKLPFPVPDPISEYERTLFETPEDFKNGYIIPETAIKLKQGAGRGHRTEKDTCVIAICDCRFAIGGSYHNRLLKVLPECNVTDDLGEVESWLESVKPTEFFM